MAMVPKKKSQERSKTGTKTPLRATVSPDAISRLQGLGFSDYEARCYISLINAPPSTAYDVSKVTGVPRANVYSALENLTRKGAVQPVSEQPARFAAVPPAELFASIAKSTAARCGEVVDLLKAADTGDRQEVVWTVSGEERVKHQIGEMMRRARKHIWIKAAENLLLDHEEELRAAHKRGVEIVIIFFGTNPKRFSFGNRSKVYLHEADGVRMGDADNLFTLTTDFAEALTARLHSNYIGAYTRSEPVVTMAETIIRHDIYIAEIYSRFRNEIEAEFGKHLSLLRRGLFSERQWTLFERNLNQVQRAENQKPGAAE